MAIIKEGDFVKVKATNEETQTLKNPSRNMNGGTSVTPLKDQTRWECSNGKTYKTEELELVNQ